VGGGHGIDGNSSSNSSTSSNSSSNGSQPFQVRRIEAAHDFILVSMSCKMDVLAILYSVVILVDCLYLTVLSLLSIISVVMLADKSNNKLKIPLLVTALK